MSVFITCRGNTYSNLKDVKFAPECDPTLETLPICQFSADIVTTNAADTFKGREADLYENRFGTDKLLAGCYTVTEAEQIAPGVVRILAKSLLQYLDGRVLPAKLYTSYINVEDFFEELYSGQTEEETEAVWVWDEDDPPIRLVSGTLYIQCFFPRQTARERLRTFCQAYGRYVIQWGANSASGLAVDIYQESSFDEYYHKYTLLPEETYKNPIVKRVSDVGTVRITGYNSHTYTYGDQSNGWEKYVIQEGWADPNTGLTLDEVAVYYRSQTWEYTINDGSGGIVEIKDNLSITGPSVMQAVRLAYFSHYEVELDALCVLDAENDNRRTGKLWEPIQGIAFSVDDSGQLYYGVVKSVEYTFGKLTRARLKIMTDMTPKSTATVVVNYGYYKNGVFTVFNQKSYAVPASYRLSVSAPKYATAFDGDELIHLTRSGNYGFQSPLSGAAGSVSTFNIAYNR